MTPYSDPNHSIRREFFAGESTAGATTESCKFRTFQKMKLKKVHAVVTVAGTSATTGNKLDIYNGTTSIGSLTMGTSIAGVSVSSLVLDSAVAALGQISVKTGTDATGKSHVIYEYQVDHDATQS